MTAELSADVQPSPSLLIPVTVACGMFMTSLDQNVVVTALPGIGESMAGRRASSACWSRPTSPA